MLTESSPAVEKRELASDVSLDVRLDLPDGVPGKVSVIAVQITEQWPDGRRVDTVVDEPKLSSTEIVPYQLLKLFQYGDTPVILLVM